MKSKTLKKILVAALGVVMAVSLAACGSSSSSSSSSGSSAKKDYSKVSVNKAKKSISFYATVNGTYFTQATRHYIVTKGKTNGDKSILRAYPSELKIYNGLKAVGGKPWDGMKIEQKGQKTQGEKVAVTLSWKGSNGEVPAAKTVKTASGAAPKIDFRYSGNLKNAKKYNVGCIACLDSCYVGIISNAAYGYGDIEGGKVKTMGNSKVLPKDGTVVKVTFTLKD
ncbi:MAG: YdjY domain-containing protein [Eubacterium sp.]|jgi:hypothetical protein|nr:YdjY domain-containing protein [Eubacterium sp.]MCH4046266.1 YdjY domain-containing protein [Eubacterium sp.]MCH4079361.1 YdjY domain-containing protein [Eubacterium sp.]MCH4110585.1 YdjY domain-containing protein [Eubacterium sp.]MCI1307488.1 YdjY domain-containing protein [Eubacterium sp.]